MKIRPAIVAISSVASLFLCQCNEEKPEENASGDPEAPEPEENQENPSKPSELPNVVSAVRGRTFEMKNLNVLKQLTVAAMVYSTENTGQFPRDYQTLVKAADFAGPVALADPNTGKEDVEPIYFAGLSDSSRGRSILLACPFNNVDGTRTVAFVDTSIRKISEEEYQKQIAAQKK